MYLWMDVWKDMKWCEKIWNDFFRKKLWNEVFPFSEYKEHCEMECEMHLWNEIIKNECVDFSWQFTSFHKSYFVKRYELICEKIWNESWKAEFISFSSQIEFYSNVCFCFLVLWPLDLIMAAYDDRNRSDSDTVLDLGIPLPNFHNHMLTSYSLLPSPVPICLSARPNRTFEDLANLCGTVGCSLPSM